MSFQIKTRVVAILGDVEKYPCHFMHQVGDEFIYDGEKFVGRICPSVTRLLMPIIMPLHAGGPRFLPPPAHYYPFWYCAPQNRVDPSMKKYDGIGFSNVFDPEPLPRYHMATMMPAGAFSWPPPAERTVAKSAFTVICPDVRTSVVFSAEAFELSDKGYDIPYYRRQMVILDRVSKQQGIPASDILNLFTKEEIEKIHPVLSPIMIESLNDELELMKYMEIKDGKAFVTEAGKKKAEAFKASLSKEEREALKV